MRSTIDPLLIPLVWVSIQQYTAVIQQRMERFLSQGAVEPKQTQIALNTSIEISLFKQHNYLTNLFVIHQDQCGKRITSSCVGLQDFSVYIFVRISETITPPKSQ